MIRYREDLLHRRWPLFPDPSSDQTTDAREITRVFTIGELNVSYLGERSDPILIVVRLRVD